MVHFISFCLFASAVLNQTSPKPIHHFTNSPAPFLIQGPQSMLNPETIRNISKTNPAFAEPKIRNNLHRPTFRHSLDHSCLEPRQVGMIGAIGGPSSGLNEDPLILVHLWSQKHLAGFVPPMGQMANLLPAPIQRSGTNLTTWIQPWWRWWQSFWPSFWGIWDGWDVWGVGFRTWPLFHQTVGFQEALQKAQLGGRKRKWEKANKKRRETKQANKKRRETKHKTPHSGILAEGWPWPIKASA